jgi:phosphate transport system permease protein
MSLSSWRSRPGEAVIVLFAWLAGIGLVAVFAVIVGFLLYRGGSVLNPGLLFGDTPPLEALLLHRPVFDGLFPALVGTLTLVLLALFAAVPVGVAAGIYLAEYCRGRLRRLLGLLFDLLAGIPSIVIGLFGLSLTIFLHHHFFPRLFPCLLISALSLAFLVLPYLVRTTQAALEEVPPEIRLGGAALGASRLQNLFSVLLPHALKGIGSGVLLATGRCAEDTAVIMLTGVVASAGIPHSLLGSYEALPFYIFYISSQYADRAELQRGYGAAIILLLLCGLLFFASRIIRRRLARRFFHYPLR